MAAASEHRTITSHLLDAGEVAAMLHVPVSWVRKNGDRLPGYLELGKYRRWNLAKIEEFIANGGRL